MVSVQDIHKVNVRDRQEISVCARNEASGTNLFLWLSLGSFQCSLYTLLLVQSLLFQFLFPRSQTPLFLLCLSEFIQSFITTYKWDPDGKKIKCCCFPSEVKPTLRLLLFKNRNSPFKLVSLFFSIHSFNLPCISFFFFKKKILYSMA